ITVGVDIASTSYSHLPKRNQVYIAIFTSLVTVLDNSFYQNHSRMEGFNERFVNGLPQDDPVLHVLDQTLRDSPEYYGQIQSNMIIPGTLDFVISLMMDMEIREITVRSISPDFAAFWRSLSGIPIGFTMFIFPKEIKLSAYIECLPHMKTYVNCMRSIDVLSFYKEEVAGEETFATSLAKGSLITNYEAIQRLADDVAEAEAIISKKLVGNQPALDSWESFKRGYVYFHTSCHRYKLDELFELPSLSHSGRAST
ncbi:terpenoid synthase, partial [Marasmius fiardii PR-910]